MKGILIYQPTSKSAPLADFIDGLDPRLREKILLRLYFLTQLEKPEMKEPHFKRFSIERYRDLWELRVKSKVLIRIIFCMLPNGDVLLLHGFVKRQKRDTMQALEQSIRILDALREHPARGRIQDQGGESVMKQVSGIPPDRMAGMRITKII